MISSKTEETAKQKAGRMGGLRRAENAAKAKMQLQAGQNSSTDDQYDEDGLKGTPNRSSSRGQSVASEASGQSKKRSTPAEAKEPSKKKAKLAETGSVSTSMLGEAESTEDVVPQHTARIAPLKAVDPCVPKHLPTLLRTEPHGDFPIIIHLSDSRVCEITNKPPTNLDYSSFWLRVTERVKQLMDLCPDETFGTVLENKDDVAIELQGDLFPTLVDAYGGLRQRPMTDPVQKIRIFQNHLSRIIKNANTLLRNSEHPTKPPTRTVSATTANLMSLNPPSLLTTKEVSFQITNFASNMLSLAENIRRELSSYGITLALLGQRTTEANLETRAIGAYILQLLLDSSKSSIVIKQENVEADDPFMDQESPTSQATQAGTVQAMPPMLYKVLGENAHACRCTICEPDVGEKLLAQATDFLRAQERKHLQDEVATALRVQALQELRPAAYEQARKEVYEAALRELTDEKAKDEQRELRARGTRSRSKGA